MTEPSEINEDISQELSTEELKGVSGGLWDCHVKGRSPMDPTGSGSGVTLKDWNNSRQVVMNPNDCPNFNPSRIGQTNN